MLVGLVLGALAGESVTSALLGGLIGLGLGQALRLQQLGADNARLREELKGFAERFERGTTAMVERLARLESGQSAAAEPAAPAAAADVPPKPEPEAAVLPIPVPVAPQPLPESPADELVWELPELPAAAAVAGNVCLFQNIRVLGVVRLNLARVRPMVAHHHIRNHNGQDQYPQYRQHNAPGTVFFPPGFLLGFLQRLRHN